MRCALVSGCGANAGCVVHTHIHPPPRGRRRPSAQGVERKSGPAEVRDQAERLCAATARSVWCLHARTCRVRVCPDRGAAQSLEQTLQSLAALEKTRTEHRVTVWCKRVWWNGLSCGMRWECSRVVPTRARVGGDWDRRGGDTGGRCTGGLCWRARVEEACCSADGAGCAAAGTNPVALPQLGFAVVEAVVEALGVAAAVGGLTAARGPNARSNGERGACGCRAGVVAAAASPRAVEVEDEGVLEGWASAARLRGRAPPLTKLKSPMCR
jgi:hypothetical protein